MFICMLCHSIYIKLCMYICFIIISVLVLILLRCKLWWRIPFTFFVLILFSFIFLFAFCCFCWCWVVATGAAVAVAIYNKFFSAVVWYYYEMPSIGPFFPTAQIQKKNRHVKRKTKVCNGCKCCTGFNFFHTLFCDFWFVSSTQFFFYFFHYTNTFQVVG